MAISINWSPIYGAGGARLTPEIAQGVIYLMRMTGKVHDRDFGKPDSLSNFVNKVNVRGAASPYYNWIKVSVGVDRDTNLQVVIIYHLLRHRLNNLELRHSAWSVSVGFDPSLLSDAWRRRYDPNNEYRRWPNAENPYLQLVKEFNKQITIDLSGFRAPDPVATKFVIYDEVDRSETDDAIPGSDPDGTRRNTRVGELGWVAQNANPVHLAPYTFRSVVINKRSIDSELNAPNGWGRPATATTPADEYIVETVVTV